MTGNKANTDKLVNSYLVVEQLASDGNSNAVSNKKTMYSFLNEDKILVEIETPTEDVSNDLNNSDKT